MHTKEKSNSSNNIMLLAARCRDKIPATTKSIVRWIGGGRPGCLAADRTRPG